MSTALVIGKFYPPHAGHHLLIDYALAECEEVTVIAIASTTDTIPVAERVGWLRAAHPGAHVLGRTIDMPVDYSSREADRAWARAVHTALADVGRPVPDLVYSSEDYGERLAEDLTVLAGHPVDHRMVDRARVAIPISATQIRHDLRSGWRHLARSTRRGLAQRIVACGAESTGSTTLSRALADRYRTSWVPEYGRLYAEALGGHHEWTTADFEHIIDRQLHLEDDLVALGGALVFCDTDPVATLMFHELYLGEPMGRDAVEATVAIARRRALYLLTDDVGVPFEEDGTRLFEARRPWSTRWFADFFAAHGIDYVRLTGSHEERLSQAVAAVEAIEPPRLVDPLEAGKADIVGKAGDAEPSTGATA